MYAVFVMPLAFWACTGPSDDGGDEPVADEVVVDTDADTELVDSDDTDPVVADPPQSLSTAEIAAGIAMVVEQVPSLDAMVVINSYEDIDEANQDPACPHSANDGTDPGWSGDCITENATHYSGEVFFRDDWSTYLNRTDFGDVLMGVSEAYVGEAIPHLNQINVAGNRVDGSGIVRKSGGHTWSFTGEAMWVYAKWRELVGYEHTLKGVLDFSGTVSGLSWFTLGWYPDLTIWHFAVVDTYLDHRLINGTVSGLLGPVTSVAFHDVEIADPNLAQGCKSEPSGSISVRGSDGEWLEVTFQGGLGLEAFQSPECDGCGTVTIEEVEQLVCVDFTMLTRPYTRAVH